jgi:predicted PurR-regulated permease PerM
MPDLLILLSTLGGLALFGASGLVLGPILAALFMAVLTIYSTVFADWLELDQVPKEIASGERNEQPISSPQNGD